jgi:hypothetical protein
MRVPRLRLALLVSAYSLVGFGQSPPAPSFELVLPDLNRTIPGGTDVVADIPLPQISQMLIQVLGSADTNLSYGDLRVRINGKGTRNVFDSGSNARGKFLAMTPATLRMRRDQIFDRQENAIEVYGKDRRGREYYQNWIVRHGKDEANPYFTYVSSLSPSNETGIAPDLSVDLPAGPVIFPTGKSSITVHVKGSASAAEGIASLTLNGKATEKQPAGRAAAIEQDVLVARGVKELLIETADKTGNKRSVAVPVVYPGAANPAPKFAGQGWAVVIGVSQFTAKSGAPPALPLAAFNAKAMADALKSRGFKDENIRLLADERATIEQVRTALGDFTAKAKPEDLLVVYWATQGLHDPASPDKVYLAASDTQLLQLADTAIEISELRLLLERAVRSRHTLLFFDAEHPLNADWGFQGRSIVNTHLLNLFDDQLGRSVLVAANPGSDSRSGEFAASVIEGLSGKADIDQNHVVTAREICDYVIDRVRKSTQGAETPKALVAKHEEETPVLALR